MVKHLGRFAEVYAKGVSGMKPFRLVHQTARNLAKQAIDAAPDGWIVKLSEPTRSLVANNLMWALLTDVSEQVVWHGNKLTATEWKCIFSASLKQQKVVPSLDGGFVVLGQSTSKMSQREMGDMIELIGAFGADKGVKFSAEA